MAFVRLIAQNKATLAKTASYYVVHILVATLVAYAVTRNWTAALTLSLIEPSVQAFAFFFHEKAWERVKRKQKIIPLAANVA